MGAINKEIPPPSHWQDFEQITLLICRKKWRNDYAEANGRHGQAQSGVDVYGFDEKSGKYTGVQCKKRKTKSKGLDVPSSALTTAEIDAEILAAGKFAPQLDRFIISTTGPRDADLQKHIRLYNQTNPSMLAAIWFWDDYIEELESDLNLLYRFYEDVIKYRNRYSENEHYLRMLALAFDRPAMRTPFHLENRATDFIQALSLLQSAITTGVLKDGSGHVIDHCRPPSQLPSEIVSVKSHLQKLRTMTTRLIKDGRIKEHASCIEIYDSDIQEKLNSMRMDIIRHLNRLFVAAKIDPISIY